MVSIDLDGTLLNSIGKISQRSVIAIRRWQQMGNIVVINSARNHRNAKAVLAEANLECPIIGSTGATIHTAEGECIARHTLSSEQIEPILEMLHKRDMSYYLHTAEGESLYHQSHQGKRRNWNRSKLIEGHPEEIEGYEFLQIMSYPNNRNQKKNTLKELQSLPVSITPSNQLTIEIIDEKATKGKALLHYADSLSIPSEQIIAFGNSFNDISMFEAATTCCAMPDSPQELLNLATHTARNDNNKDGVAIELENLYKQLYRQRLGEKLYSTEGWIKDVIGIREYDNSR